LLPQRAWLPEKISFVLGHRNKQATGVIASKTWSSLMNNRQQNDVRASDPKTSPSLKPADMMAAASTMAEGAAGKMKDVAAETVSTVSEQLVGLLDRQVGAGADLVSQVARSADRAAEELDDEAPRVAEFIRTAAGQMDGYAGDLRDKSVSDLMQSVSDFTRQKPALVFGAAALAGFLAVRMIKSASPVSSPSIQPDDEASGQTARTRKHATRQT
jgi:hypothetical protein